MILVLLDLAATLTVRDEVKRKVVKLRSVRLAGVRFRNIRAAIGEQPDVADANVGVKLLRHFKIVTDFPQRAVWLQPRRKGPAGETNARVRL